MYPLIPEEGTEYLNPIPSPFLQIGRYHVELEYLTHGSRWHVKEVLSFGNLQFSDNDIGNEISKVLNSCDWSAEKSRVTNPSRSARTRFIKSRTLDAEAPIILDSVQTIFLTSSVATCVGFRNALDRYGMASPQYLNRIEIRTPPYLIGNTSPILKQRQNLLDKDGNEHIVILPWELMPDKQSMDLALNLQIRGRFLRNYIGDLIYQQINTIIFQLCLTALLWYLARPIFKLFGIELPQSSRQGNSG
jgi:hypothetical protein